MITLETLLKNRDWVLNNATNLNYISVPNPMFIDGKFNPENWKGGDAVIRQFTSHIGFDIDWQKVYMKKNSIMVLDYVIEEDQTYVNIARMKSYCSGISSDVYRISWYKDRGRTEVVELNGGPISETDYVNLLNYIESMTKFKFEFH